MTYTELSHDATELVLIANNTEAYYFGRILPIVANLKKKAAKGVYDANKAVTLWKYLIDDVAKNESARILREWGEIKRFSVSDRLAAAADMAAQYHEDIFESVEA